MTSEAALGSQTNELEALRHECCFPLSCPTAVHLHTEQIKQLTEEHAASKEAATSFENTNKLLKGSSCFIVASHIADRFTPAKITELQSGQVARPARPDTQKKNHIHRPKGSKWCLMDEMGLAHDEDKYK